MTPLASLARSCYAAALEAVHPRNLMGRLSFTAAGVSFQGATLRPKGKLVLVSVGKAAGTMAEAFLAKSQRRPDQIFILVPRGVSVPETLLPFTHFGTHPGVSAENVAATASLMNLLQQLNASDGVVMLISGGASALLSLPLAGISWEQMDQLTRELALRGAHIGELNTVRKHLGAVLGGRLARLCPAQILALVLSDVPTVTLDTVASGPTMPDPTTCPQALAVLRRFGLQELFPSVTEFLGAGTEETPKPGDPSFRRVHTLLLASNREALEAIKAMLVAAGFEPRTLTTRLRGEAREVGRTLAALLKVSAPGIAWLAAGETTVTVRGQGQGGRNLELALAAAATLEGCQHRCLLAASTDGVDGNSPAAGAVVDGQTLWRARKAGRDYRLALDKNDAWGFFSGLPEAILVGPTGTNVADLVVALSAPQARLNLPRELTTWEQVPAPLGCQRSTRGQ